MEMENKDNVYVLTESAGESMEDSANATQSDVSQEAPTALGKFKDVDALYKAYSSLQAEFTRRSQRLKELEKLAENLGEERRDSSAAAEKLRKNSKLVKERERAFDGFVAELEQTGVREDSLLEPDGKQGDKPQQTATLVAEREVVAEQGMSAERGEQVLTGGTSVEESRETAELSSSALYERVRCDEGVRLRIIGEYLASVGKGVVPLTKGGAGTLAAPVLKAKTLDEAGNMALMMFKRGGDRA